MHDLDSDRGATEPGLDNVGALETRLHCLTQCLPRKRGDLRSVHQATERQLVHTHGAGINGGSGRGDIEQAEDCRGAAAFAQSTVKTQQSSVDIERLLAHALLDIDSWFPRNHDLGFLGSRRRSRQKVLRLRPRRDHPPGSRVGLIQGDNVMATLQKHPLGLETGQNRDFVFGAWSAKHNRKRC